MENFFYRDDFCADIEELIEYLEYDEDEVAALPDTWIARCEKSEPKKVGQVDLKFVQDAFLDSYMWRCEERIGEDCIEHVEKQVRAAIAGALDVNKLNELLPSLYYPTNEFFVITKHDLFSYMLLTKNENKPQND